MANPALLIQSLEKGLSVLECFRDYETLGLQEIANVAGITLGSAQRVAYTLEHAGYLTKDPQTKRYRVSVKAVGLGYSYLRSGALLQQAHSVMHQLNQACGEVVNLSVPDNCNHMVFVMRVAPAKTIPLYMPVGTQLPCHATASGRAIWSALPGAVLEEKLAALAATHTEVQPGMSVDDLRGLIQQARADLYAYADEAFYVGDINVAAAIKGQDGEPIASINISVPKLRWTLERARAELGPLVVEAARAISR